MAEVDPAVAHVECPECGEVVDIEIPVRVEIRMDVDTGYQFAQAYVRSADWSPQAAWDHILEKHGPYSVDAREEDAQG